MEFRRGGPWDPMGGPWTHGPLEAHWPLGMGGHGIPFFLVSFLLLLYMFSEMLVCFIFMLFCLPSTCFTLCSFHFISFPLFYLLPCLTSKVEFIVTFRFTFMCKCTFTFNCTFFTFNFPFPFPFILLLFVTRHVLK